MKIENEQAYPIYRIEVKWIQDGIHSEEYGSNHKGLKKGRIRSSYSYSKMWKDKKTTAWLLSRARKMWKVNMKNDERIGNPSSPRFEIKFIRYETWVLRKFNHYTIDTGQTDKEALESFERYVCRRIDKGRKDCLMGAEDRYRWHGSEGEDKDSDPPCRCKFCKEKGIISIDH